MRGYNCQVWFPEASGRISEYAVSTGNACTVMRPLDLVRGVGCYVCFMCVSPNKSGNDPMSRVYTSVRCIFPNTRWLLTEGALSIRARNEFDELVRNVRNTRRTRDERGYYMCVRTPFLILFFFHILCKFTRRSSCKPTLPSLGICEI